MAKAKATCKCSKCGATFTKTKVVANRAAAYEWEAWAEEHFDLCPDCYEAQKEAELAKTHEIREMHYAEYKKNYSECKTVSGSYDAKAKTIKVFVKKAEEKKPETAEASAPVVSQKTMKKCQKIANLSKSEIFKYAHQLTKQTMKVGDDYRATFAICLRTLYGEIKDVKAFLAKAA